MIAIPLLLTAAAQADDDPAELYRQGMRLMGQQQPQAAIALFQRSLQLRPNDAGTWATLGVAYSSLGDYQHAEEPFHKACLLKPLLPDACLYFGRTLYLLDRFEPALDVLHRAEGNDPQNAQIRRVEALCLAALGRASEAEAAFREAVRLGNGAAAADDPAIDYAVFLFHQGRAEQALGPLESAIKQHADVARAQLELGCVLLALDRLEEAAKHLERAVALDPGSQRAHLLLGKVYLRMGK
jgi:tetratricopeptide (TPR) repeat protein